MSRYLCEACGAVFAEPLLRSYADHGPDNIRIPYTTAICPECYEEDIEALTEEQEDDMAAKEQRTDLIRTARRISEMLTTALSPTRTPSYRETLVILAMAQAGIRALLQEENAWTN